MKTVAVVLVCVGAALLSVSLVPASRISRQEGANVRGWRFLTSGILLFLFCYLAFISYMMEHPLAGTEWVASVILCGGGVFVFGVTCSTLASFRHMQKLADKERHQALHDELTGLPNRFLLQDRIAYAILLARRQCEPMALLLMDLDQFKTVNVAMGHGNGDLMLQKVATRFAGAIRATDTLARLGGDEFAVVLSGAGLEQAMQIAGKLSRVLDAPFALSGHSLAMRVSIGVAVFPEHGEDPASLLQHADSAMYVAKNNDMVYSIYDPGSEASSMSRLIVIGQLREAIASGQLLLHYQPKVSLSENRLTGVEALVRWLHPREGDIPPSYFIPLAEQAGLIKPLTRWVLDRALEQNRRWRDDGCRLPVSVNLSVKNIQDLAFPALVRELMERWGTDSADLTLEITESSMMTDPERARQVIEELTGLGVTLSIDDFGTGYSSLSYLLNFPASEVKIDRSFIIDMAVNEGNAVIVRSTIDMLHSIGRKVVAEGVEDHATARLLHSLGCDCLQGFHICRPLAVAAFDSWLAESSFRADVSPAVS